VPLGAVPALSWLGRFLSGVDNQHHRLCVPLILLGCTMYMGVAWFTREDVE